MNDHLTKPEMANPKMLEWISKTHPGQAHWAGMGPEGRTCRECSFWKAAGHYANSGKHPRQLKDARCNKFRQLRKKNGPPVPFHAPSCSFFDESPSPPAARSGT